MRRAVRAGPQILDPGPLEEPVDGLDRRLAERAGERACEPLEVLGQLVLERGLRIEVRVELVDDVDRDRAADLVVLEKL